MLFISVLFFVCHSYSLDTCLPGMSSVSTRDVVGYKESTWSLFLCQ